MYHYKPEKCPHWDFQNKIESIEASECPAGMNCNKCHGWMEHRYHPSIFKQKNQFKPVTKKEELIEKKLTSQTKKQKEKESNIESIITKETKEM